MKKKIVTWLLVLTMILAYLPGNMAQAATYQTGSRGEQVQYLQQNLTFLGFSTEGADGEFGNNTKKAVYMLQTALELPKTGIVDDALDNLIKNTVSDIQKYLKYKGYYNGAIDGTSGRGTQNALKKLQKELGKKQTGITDSVILNDIVKDTNANVEMKNLREWVARLNGTYAKKLDSKYYDKYGEDYLKLFTEYPELLTIDEQILFIDFKSSEAKKMHEKAKEEYIEASVWEGFANGVSWITKEVLAKFGVGKNAVDQTTYDSIMALVSKMYYKDNEVFESIKKSEEALNQFGNIYSIAELGTKASVVAKLLKENPNLTKGQIEKVLDLVVENWSGISKKLGNSVTAAEYIVSALQLYTMTGDYIRDLQNVVKQPSALYGDLEYLIQEREKNLEEFLINELATEGTITVVEELLSVATAGMFEQVTDGIDFLSKFAVKASVNEQVYAFLFEAYSENLEDTVFAMKKDFAENGKAYTRSEMAEKIEKYETAYSFYLCAIETYYESVMKMVSKNEASLIQIYMNFLADYSYDTYIEACMKKMYSLLQNENLSVKPDSVTGRMDSLLQKLGVQNGKKVYFTVNQKACEPSWESGHGCDNCNMRDIAKTTWFKNLFGTVNVDNFPEHDVDASRHDHTGQSCFGFACFAQWYLYADSNTDKVTGERIAAVKFNKANMERYVQPGDVIRVNGHSVLVYSIEKDGLMVIDCNWNSSGQLNCLVQKHLLSYSNTRYADYMAYINRVKENGVTSGSSTTSSSSKTNATANTKTQYVYYHYTNAAGEYSVCGHWGANVNGWTNVYREEIWLDKPLEKIDSGYRHAHVAGCDEIGCWSSDYWENGGKYIDKDGAIWYREQTKTVAKDANQTQSFSVIYEKVSKPVSTPKPTATPRPTVAPKPTVTPRPTVAPKATATPIPEREVSGWVKVSECPAGVQIVDTKWTYTYTDRIESLDTGLENEGWIREGERKEVVGSGTFDYAAFPDTFDTSHVVYTSMYTDKNVVPVMEGATREILSDAPAGYVYWHYSYPMGDRSVGNRIVGYYYNQNLKYVGNWCYATEFSAFKSAKNYATTANNKEGGGTVYKVTDSEYVTYDVAKGSHWWYRFAYNTCVYQDVKTVYQYYKNMAWESTSEVYEGNGNSNVVKWVRYK